MKGFVFSEFLDLVEEKFGYKLQREIIQKSGISHEGVYVSAGYYPFEEMQMLVVALSEQTKIEVPVLLREFGKFLFGRLAKGHAQMISEHRTAFALLEAVNGYIHVEIRKLYADAELPEFRTISRSESSLQLEYKSKRKLEALAEGMILACGEHYGTPLQVSLKVIGDDPVHTVLIDIQHVKAAAGGSAAKAQRSQKSLWQTILGLFSSKK